MQEPMPNFYLNTLVITPRDQSAKALQQLVDCSLTIGEPLDFNRIVPTPDILVDADAGTKSTWAKPLLVTPGGGTREATPDETREMKDIGYLNWDSWAYDHWGVNSNARNVKRMDGDDVLAIHFETPGTPPFLIFEAMAANYPLLEVKAKWTRDNMPDGSISHIFRIPEENEFTLRDLEFSISRNNPPELLVRTKKMEWDGPEHWIKVHTIDREQYDSMQELFNPMQIAKQLGRAWIHPKKEWITINKDKGIWHLEGINPDPDERVPQPLNRSDALASKLASAGMKPRIWEGRNCLRVYLELPDEWKLGPGITVFFNWDREEMKDALQPYLGWEAAPAEGATLEVQARGRDVQHSVLTRLKDLLKEHGMNEIFQDPWPTIKREPESPQVTDTSRPSP